MSTISVLLIEDEELIAEGITEVLEENNIRVVLAKCLPSALHKARNEKFDCIVCDYKLEKGTGQEFILGIRKSIGHLNQKTPALLMSAYMSADIVEALGRVIQGALVKPYKLEVLVEKVFDMIA